MAVKFHFTNAQYGYKIAIPFYAGRIYNYDENREFSLSAYNYPVQVYENLDVSWYDSIHKYTYEEVLANTITDTYTCDENSDITADIRYVVYPASVVGKTNNQGYEILISFKYKGSASQIGGAALTIGMGYPNPSPASITTLAGDYGPMSLVYDTFNKLIFNLPTLHCKVTSYENLTGRDYGDITTTTVDKFSTRPKGTYNYMSYTTAFQNAGINSNRITSADIGKQYINVISNGGRLDNSVAQHWYGGYRCFFEESGITPPTYPNQNPDSDNDGTGQQPSDPPIPGDGDVTSDPIPDPPPLPLFDVTNTGFVVIYNPSVTEIRELAYFMWSGEFVDLIKKMFASPFEAIISLKMLFCPVTAGASQTVWLGNVETDVTMAKVTSQFTDVDMGTLNVNEFFGSFADYAPFTKIQIYLPFIGFKDLNVDEVMNSQLHLRYRVDVYTGACIAYLTVTKTIKSTSLNSILYQFDGNCAMEIPFTSNDNSRYVSAIMNSVASSALSLANTSGFTLPTPAKGFNQKAEPGTFELGSLAPVANGMLDIMSTKPNVQRAGSLSGAVSAMAVKQPYLIIHRPIAQMPANYQHYIGIPLNLTRTLSNVKGFTVVSQVFMTSEVATDEEIVMITEMLKNGVIL